jgi:HEAT repeat protein
MSATELVRALAVAWSTKQLYPNPLDVESFQDALRRLGANADERIALGIGLDGFEHEGELVEVQQAAAVRLAQALFAAEVHSVTVASAPTERDVMQFLALVERAQEREQLSISAGLAEMKVSSIRVKMKDMLDEREPGSEAVELDPDIDSIREVLKAEQEAADLVAAELRQLADGSDHEAAVELDRRYVAAWEAVATEDDWAAREEAVRLYTDVYLELPRETQKHFLAMALSRRDERMYANFLDQFGSSELAEMAIGLEKSSLDMLIDYARVVSEEESGRRELLDLIGSENFDLDAARTGIVGVVGKRLEAVSTYEQTGHETAVAMRAELDSTREASPGVSVASALLEIEQRGDRRGRLSRIWVAKIHNALSAGDFDAGLAWLNALETAVGFDPAEQGQLHHQLVTGEILMGIAMGDHPKRQDLLGWFARHSGGELVAMLAEEEDQSRRRMLIDVVAQVAGVDLESVLPSLRDERWYVVRNVVLALGKSRQRDAAGPLSELLDHEDHRVRIEVLRSLSSCGGEEAIGWVSRLLRDGHVRVRSVATDLLVAAGSPAAQRALIAAAKDESMETDERVHLINALGKVDSAEARRTLEGWAKGRGGLFGTGRVLKRAARQALGRRK